MSLHQVNSDVLHSPLSGMNTAPSHAAASLQAHLFASMPNVVLQGQSSQLKSVDLMHFQRVLDILEKAVKESDQKTVICMLVVMQLMFRTNLFQEGSTEEAELLKKTKLAILSSKHTAVHCVLSLMITFSFCEALCCGASLKSIGKMMPISRAQILPFCMRSVSPSQLG